MTRTNIITLQTLDSCLCLNKYVAYYEEIDLLNVLCLATSVRFAYT